MHICYQLKCSSSILCLIFLLVLSWLSWFGYEIRSIISLILHSLVLPEVPEFAIFSSPKVLRWSYVGEISREIDQVGARNCALKCFINIRPIPNKTYQIKNTDSLMLANFCPHHSILMEFLFSIFRESPWVKNVCI